MDENAETAPEAPLDYEAIRRRFPWVGLGPDEEHDFSQSYRDVMAAAGAGREIIEAVETIRRSARTAHRFRPSHGTSAGELRTKPMTRPCERRRR
ncbi:hypothetical protein [Sphaerisporangium sp. NPDC051011]|uniref:hypothetical protein n=1 Tax=Sphaerisporangium sp. NPDC051011 TaxID=3155792 RepID=UPI0033F66323